MRALQALTFAALAFPLAPSLLGAQAVHGVVTLESAGTPVSGALVALIDRHGATVHQTTSLDNGRYSLRSSGPGWYRIRVLRIGFQSFLSDSLHLQGQARRRFDLQVPNAVVMLPPIEVAGAPECRRGTGDAAAAVLWEEVRKAVALTAHTFDLARHRFVVEQFDRETAPTGRVVRESQSRTTMQGSWPIQAAPPETLSAAGYVVPASRQFADLLYYGPDATTLFSPSFINDHCLWSSSADRTSDLVLHFKPVPSRRVADIRGALSLDRRTLKLRSLTFEFVQVPDWIPRGSAGGKLAFAHTPTGEWYIASWSMRVPIPRTSPASTTVVLHGYREQGGKVVRVQDLRRART